MSICFHMRRRLLAYCEGEADQDERDSIEAHLSSCSGCRAHVERIRKSTRLVRQLQLLNPADKLWDSITSELTSNRFRELPRVGSPRVWLGFGKRWMLRAAVLAVVLVTIATALLPAGRYGLPSGRDSGELNLAGYLEHLASVASADTTPMEFPTAPGFTTVNWAEAQAAANFSVIGPESLPGGYLLTSVRLYTRGELRALQLKYRGEWGGLCVFQMPAGSKLSLGTDSLNDARSGAFSAGARAAEVVGFTGLRSAIPDACS